MYADELISNPALSTLPGSSGGFTVLNQTNWGPGDIPLVAPDANVAVGPSHVVVVANSSIAVFEKADPATTLTTNMLGTSTGFFGANSLDETVFDPKCVYDQLSGRFMVIAIESALPGVGTWESALHLAVSETSDPTGSWLFYVLDTSNIDPVDASRQTFVDQPSIGYNDDHILISGDFRALGTGDIRAYVSAIRKLRAHDPNLAINPEEQLYLGLQHCQPIQPFENVSDNYFAGFEFPFSTDVSDGIQIFSLVDPFTPNVQLAAAPEIVTGVNFAYFSLPADLPNPVGETQALAMNDSRLLNLRHHNGFLYTTLSSRVPSVNDDNVVHWFKLALNGWPGSGSSPTLSEAGSFRGNSDEHYFYPAVFTDAHENLGVVMGHSSPLDFANIQVAAKPASGPMGTPKLIVSGDSRPSSALQSCNCRWGDYFDIVLDPADDITFWFAGAYEIGNEWNVYVDSFRIACSPADLNADGLFNFFDVSLFIQYFNAQNPIVDYNSDGNFDFFDVSEFIQLFNAACP